MHRNTEKQQGQILKRKRGTNKRELGADSLKILSKKRVDERDISLGLIFQ